MNKQEQHSITILHKYLAKNKDIKYIKTQVNSDGDIETVFVYKRAVLKKEETEYSKYMKLRSAENKKNNLKKVINKSLNKIL